MQSMAIPSPSTFRPTSSPHDPPPVDFTSRHHNQRLAFVSQHAARREMTRLLAKQKHSFKKSGYPIPRETSLISDPN